MASKNVVARSRNDFQPATPLGVEERSDLIENIDRSVDVNLVPDDDSVVFIGEVSASDTLPPPHHAQTPCPPSPPPLRMIQPLFGYNLRIRVDMNNSVPSDTVIETNPRAIDGNVGVDDEEEGEDADSNSSGDLYDPYGDTDSDSSEDDP